MHSAPLVGNLQSLWILRAITFALSSTVVAAGFGLLLGRFGGLLPEAVRLALGTLAGTAAIFLGVLLIARRAVKLPQFDSETPQRWVNLGGLRWAMLNGAALGLGFASRIGFWIWYVIPVGAFLSGDGFAGGIVYGVYGAVRGWMVWTWLIVLRGDRNGEDLSRRLLWSYAAAARSLEFYLLFLGLVVVVLVGP